MVANQIDDRLVAELLETALATSKINNIQVRKALVKLGMSPMFADARICRHAIVAAILTLSEHAFSDEKQFTEFTVARVNSLVKVITQLIRTEIEDFKSKQSTDERGRTEGTNDGR